MIVVITDNLEENVCESFYTVIHAYILFTMCKSFFAYHFFERMYSYTEFEQIHFYHVRRTNSPLLKCVKRPKSFFYFLK